MGGKDEHAPIPAIRRVTIEELESTRSGRPFRPTATSAVARFFRAWRVRKATVTPDQALF